MEASFPPCAFVQLTNGQRVSECFRVPSAPKPTKTPPKITTSQLPTSPETKTSAHPQFLHLHCPLLVPHTELSICAPKGTWCVLCAQVMMLSSIYSVDETAPAMKLSPDGKTKLKHAANDLEVSWIMDASHISPQSNNPIIHHPLKLACREIPLLSLHTDSGEASPKTAWATVRRGTPDSEKVELGAENNSSKDHRCTVSLRCGQCFTVHRSTLGVSHKQDSKTRSCWLPKFKKIWNTIGNKHTHTNTNIYI